MWGVARKGVGGGWASKKGAREGRGSYGEGGGICGAGIMERGLIVERIETKQGSTLLEASFRLFLYNHRIMMMC